MVSSMPTLYNVDNNTNEGEAVMVPVASTVIPLEDLPVFKVDLLYACLFQSRGHICFEMNLMFFPTSLRLFWSSPTLAQDHLHNNYTMFGSMDYVRQLFTGVFCPFI